MLFNASIFVFAFLPAVLLVNHVLRRINPTAAIAFLAACSLIFWTWDGWTFLPVYVGSVTFNYLCARTIVAAPPGQARIVTALGVGANVALLAFFKYANFIMLAAGLRPFHEFALPLGISFFTFTQIAYLVDTWRDRRCEPGFVRYTLFVSYFPHLIAGPIIHHKDVMPQFTAAPAPTKHEYAAATTLFAIGLAKKMAADMIARASDVNRIFDLAEQAIIGTQPGWLAAAGYMLQIYLDFSAYCDMAVAVSLALGVKLPANFLSPYRSTSIIEFWRRWHITLSRFLRDYVYIPLGGNRRGLLRRYFNLLVTMTIGGLWHGANWTFLAWGAFHGALLVINHLWAGIALPFRAALWWRLLAWGLTMACVLVGWVLFRAHSLVGALNILTGMFNYRYAGMPSAEEIGLALVLMAILIVLAKAPNAYEIMAAVKPAQIDDRAALSPTRLFWRSSAGWAIISGALAAFGLLRSSKIENFLYFQF